MAKHKNKKIKAKKMKFKLGRIKPKSRGYALTFGHYMQADFPAAPAGADYSTKTTGLHQVYMNDKYADCVPAGIAHLVGVFTANAGAEITFKNAEVLALYTALTGFNPNKQRTDCGCNEVDALNYWKEHGIKHNGGAHKIAGWLKIDGKNYEEVKSCIWLFENVVFGVEMPQSWCDNEPDASGWVWDVNGDADENNGHCFVGMGYDEKGVKICSWGMTGTITPRAVAAYAGESGELYAVISQEALLRGQEKFPNGFDWETLKADFTKMGGDL